jgi:hypothetical protein
LRDVRGDDAFAAMTLTPAELTNGVESWRLKIDPRERERRQRLGFSP